MQTIVYDCNTLQQMNLNMTGIYILNTSFTCNFLFTPIGNITTPFTGSIDGQNNTIFNFTMNFGLQYGGLIGYFFFKSIS